MWTKRARLFYYVKINGYVTYPIKPCGLRRAERLNNLYFKLTDKSVVRGFRNDYRI